MPEETAGKLFKFLSEKNIALYKATIESLAKQRKLRTVFVERKPRNERNAWLKDALGRKTSEAIAAHVLQIWLVGEHRQLLCDFLDSLQIAHDKDGMVESLPPAPAKEELLKAIESLLPKHDQDVVTVYLHAFQAIDDKGWQSLSEILEEDERFSLKAKAAA